MSAFNVIEIVGHCPACSTMSTLRAQLHHGASFEGDETGRFHGRTYAPGERLAWWQPTDPRFSSWRAPWGRRDNSGLRSDQAEEVCEVVCSLCGATLFVLLRVSNFVVDVIATHGPDGPPDDDWGAGYRGGYFV